MNRDLARRVLRALNEQGLKHLGLKLLRQRRAEELEALQVAFVESTNGSYLAAAAPATTASEDDAGAPLLRAEALVEPEPGLRFWIDLLDPGVSYHVRRGDYEPPATRFVTRTLRPGGVFVDVGANLGWFALHAARRVGPAGQVIALEPRADSCLLLRRAVAANGFGRIVRVLPAAAGREAGRRRLVWERGQHSPGGTWSMTHDALEAALPPGDNAFMESAVVRLDDVLGELPVDLVKIDIEGAEPDALAGAGRLLSRTRPKVLCEINPPLLRQVGRTEPAAFVDWMAGQGYRCHTLEADGTLGDSLSSETFAAEPGVLDVVFVPMG